MSWVLIVGDLHDGVADVIGPFETEEQAEDYADRYNLGHFDRFPFEMSEPKRQWRGKEGDD